MNGNGFVGHLTDPPCKMRLAEMFYDSNCPRCCMIKKVVLLRRKRQELGCSEEEETAAQTISDQLVAKYGLTRGEVYDRLYTPPPTVQEFKETVVWAVRKQKAKGGPRRTLSELG